MRHSPAFLTYLLLLASTQVGAQMSLPGDFGVSPAGAATYSIPIQVPAGFGGIEPKLSLVYNSQAGNGQLGVGWGLSGLSSITRCPQTVPQDGARGAVNYTASDRFCLDGKRLVLKAGTYGADGATYGTELETFAHVTSKGAAAGGGPVNFTVQTRDGLTLEYGNTADSRIAVVGAALSLNRVWALNKVRDAKGNYLTVTYVGDTTNGSYYPSTISYTANDTPGKAVSAASKVTFTYDSSRLDVSSGYQAGYVLGNKYRLKTVTTATMVSNVLTNVLTYTLSYLPSADSGRSRLTTIQLCNGAGANCLPPTTIAYPPAVVASGPTLTKQVAGDDLKLVSNPTAGGPAWYAVDLKGDGLVGFVHLTYDSANGGYGDAKLWLSKGDGTFTRTTSISIVSGTGAGLDYGWQPLDINGDAIPDFYRWGYNVFGDTKHPFSTQRQIILNPGSGTSLNVSSAFDNGCSGCFDQLVDVDGDGLGDIVSIDMASSNAVLWKSNGDGTFGVRQADGTYKANRTDAYSQDINRSQNGWTVVDANGDGLLDLVHLDGTTGTYYTWLSTGTGTFNIKISTTTVDTNLSAGKWLTLDVNGDGLLDLIHLTSTANTAYAWLNKGDGTFKVVSVGTISPDTTPVSGESWIVVDFNGDGLWDLVHIASIGSTAYVWQSNGNGTFAVKSISGGTVDTALKTGVWKSATLRGDGVVDLAHFLDDSGNYVIWKMPRPSDVATSIDNGLGYSASWTTAPLPQMLTVDPTNGGAYIKAAATGYPQPQTTSVPSLWVVTQSRTSDGLSGTRNVGYNYGSARLERAGRGYLGFEWTESIDLATGYVSRTTFSQTFPFTGRPVHASAGKSRASLESLSATTSQFGCVEGANASNAVLDITTTTCTPTSGKRYFPYVKQVDTSSYDLDGTALPPRRTTYSGIDAFGNVGTVVSKTLNSDLSDSVYSKTATNVYYNDPLKWILGRVVKSTVATTGPDLPAVVVPGSGNLPAAAPPKLPPQILMPILQLLLDD